MLGELLGFVVGKNEGCVEGDELGIVVGCKEGTLVGT